MKLLKKIRVMICYSHKDLSYRNELENGLTPLVHEGMIEIWSDRKISPGDDWKNRIDENLEIADIILLLVSTDFLASDYCYNKEMKRALKRHDHNDAVVVPIIVRDVSWHHTPLGKLQALPTDGKAIALWRHRDSAWRNVTEKIDFIVNNMRKTKYSKQQAYA